LNLLNKPGINISTAEDLRKLTARHQSGERQRQGGTDISAALKSFLRQDPDIIMVGETAIWKPVNRHKGRQTGHLVLSTLHTNDALLH
jgi:type IV pilus assembly protein PilB